MKQVIKTECQNCGKVFIDNPLHIKRKIYCSKICKNRYLQRKYQKRMRRAYKIMREFENDELLKNRELLN